MVALAAAYSIVGLDARKLQLDAVCIGRIADVVVHERFILVKTDYVRVSNVQGFPSFDERIPHPLRD